MNGTPILYGLGLAWALFAAVPAQGQEAVAPPVVEALMPSDSQWLSALILSDTGRDAQATFLVCVSEAILRDPGSGLVGQEQVHPGVTDFVVSDVTAQLRTRFAPRWISAQAELATRLDQYPASQRTAVRAFFESPTGIKFLGALNAQLAEPLPPFDRARGMDQCRRTPPTVAAFEAQMTDEDRRRFAQFSADPGGQLTPGSSLQLGADIGGATAAAFFADFGDFAGPLINRARANFVAAHRPNGAH